MQITLVSVSSGDTVSDVLNRFETNFSLNWVEIEEKFSRWMVSISESLIKKYSIRELKAMTDFLATTFNVVGRDAPKRNSKVSLAGWIAEVLLSAREVWEASEAIAQSGKRSPDKNYWCPQCEKWIVRSDFNEVLGSDFQEQLCKVCGSEVCHEFDRNSPAAHAQNEETSEASEATKQITDVKCPSCGYVHGPFQNTLCTYGDPNPDIPEIEVLEPEKKPVYTISIIADGSFSEERVNRLPPYLIDRKGNLLKKFWHRSCDAGYSEIEFKHLSNIAVDSGLVIKLMAENLEVSQACICGDPPPFIVDRGGVYKRDRSRLSLGVRYVQVISEYLSNIVVV